MPKYTVFSFAQLRWWRMSLLGGLGAVVSLLALAPRAIAHDLSVDDFNALGTLWLIIAAALVFFMNAGFAMLETGLCRTANAVNVLAKNLIVFCVASLAFWLFGFRFMFGDSPSAWIGQMGLPLSFDFPSATVPNPFPKGFESLRMAWDGRSFAAVFFFQLAFAGTAATIISGAVAERIKFWAFLLFSAVFVGVVYPLIGHWVWGADGALAALPFQFRDFAGATVVHSVGGMAALVGTMILKPRQGKFGYNIETNQYAGREDESDFHYYSLSLATLGCLILWLGWFGFNGGSTPQLTYVPYILTTTFISAAAGGVGTLLFSPFITNQKARLSAIINGILGGLVGITAACAYVDVSIAALIGATSSLLVLCAEKFLASKQIDDPVGAIPVHLVCGGWGTLAVGLFAQPTSSEYQLETYSRMAQTLYQAAGWGLVTGTVALLSLFIWMAIGLVLYALQPKEQKISRVRMEHLANSYSGQPWGRPLYCLFNITRHGLRVPLKLEQAGAAPTILP